MQLAPPVELQVPGWKHTGAALAALCLIVSLSAGSWASSAAGDGRTAWPAWVAFAFIAGGPLACSLQWLLKPPRPFTLRWDGQAWWLRFSGAEESMGDVEVSIDLGAWILLRWHHLDGSRGPWLSVERSVAPAKWHGLRCALYSRRPTPALTHLSSPTAAMTDPTP